MKEVQVGYHPYGIYCVFIIDVFCGFTPFIFIEFSVKLILENEKVHRNVLPTVDKFVQTLAGRKCLMNFYSALFLSIIIIIGLWVHFTLMFTTQDRSSLSLSLFFFMQHTILPFNLAFNLRDGCLKLFRISFNWWKVNETTSVFRRLRWTVFVYFYHCELYIKNRVN